MRLFGELLDYTLGGSDLNYICYRACVRIASLAERHAEVNVELGNLARQKELSGGQ